MLRRAVKYIERIVIQDEAEEIYGIGYWRDKLFAGIIALFIPLGALGTAHAILVSLHNKLWYLTTPLIMIYLIFVCLGLSRRLPLNARKHAFFSLIYILTTIMLINSGFTGPGHFWLTSIAVLYVLIYPQTGYKAIVWNALVYLLLGAIGISDLIPETTLGDFSFWGWVSLWINTTIMNIVIIFSIRTLVNGLEKKIVSLTVARRDLAQQEEYIKAISSSILDGMISVDLSGNVRHMNETAQRMTGYRFSESRRIQIEDIYITKDPYSNKYQKNHVDELLQDLSNNRLQKSLKMINKGVKVYDIVQSLSRINNKQGEVDGILIMIKDITKEKEKEGEILQAQKMEALGRLAGGIAHDFNNTLTGIKGYTQLLQMQLTNQPTLYEYCDEILKTTDLASDYISRLLSFTHKKNIEPKQLDFNACVESAVNLAQKGIRDVQIERDLYPNTLMIWADPAQIQNMVMNLIINASDSMEGMEGKVTVRTSIEKAPYDGEQPQNATCDYAVLTVTDEGCGMTEAVKSKVFEPFFTTKDIGKGTGIGLSTVYGTVTAHHGNITIQSQEGKGTQVRVLLPISQEI